MWSHAVSQENQYLIMAEQKRYDSPDFSSYQNMTNIPLTGLTPYVDKVTGITG
jgi:hypothetical protein